MTAAHDEAQRLRDLAASLADQEPGRIGLWVVVDDGSNDGTAAAAESLSLPFPVLVHRRRNSGGLRAASEFAAFREGVAEGLRALPKAEWVMKLDADLRLHADHLSLLDAAVKQDTGMVGGVIEGGDERAQGHHVRGGLRGYSRQAWSLTTELPVALGWDVLDQVAVRRAGLDVRLVPQARATTSRRTGSSVGLLPGRERLGIACRWTGYLPIYFLLKLARTALQPPALRGAAATLRGYAAAGTSPFPEDLLDAHRSEQRARLRELVRRPSLLRRLYPS